MSPTMWRSAGEADDEAIVSLCRDLNSEDPGPLEVPPDHVRGTLSELRRSPWRGEARVLDVDGRVEGYALLVGFWSNEMGGEVRLVDEVYVSPPQRGRGHATALIGGLAQEAAAVSSPIVALGLEVRPGNPRARALYERLGFSGDTAAMFLRLRPRT